MAIARDTITLSAQGSSSTRTTAHTTTGTNPVMVVFLRTESSVTVSSMEYNGVAMTHVGTSTIDSYSPAHNLWAYILANPSAGTNNLIYNLSGSSYNYAWIATYTGCNQTGIPDASSFPAGTTGTSLSTNITTIAANSWIVGNFESDNGGTLAATGAGTIQGSTAVAGTRYMDSNGPITIPASTAFGFTTTTSGGLGLTAVSLAPKLGTIAFDTNSGSLGSAASGNITVGSLTNGWAFVELDASTDTVTAVSVNSVAGTLVQKGQPSGGNFKYFYSVPLGTVSGSIAWTVTGTHNDAAISSYSGVKQSAPVQSSQVTTVTSNNSVSLTGTATTDGCWAMVVTGKNGACAVDSLTNITNRYNTSSANSMVMGDSNDTLINGVGYTQTVTSSGCAQNHLLIQAIIEPETASGPANLKSLSGNLKANIKSRSGNALANIKSISGNA